MEQQAQTVNGIMSNIQDSVTQSIWLSLVMKSLKL